MSGTSLDGLDIAACEFWYTDKEKTEWAYKIASAECFEYDAEWKQKLGTAHTLSGAELIALDKAYGQYIGEQVKAFLRLHGFQADLIASHGHTIFHDPARQISFQLGHGAAIHAETGIGTVCDFRSVDVSLGGQGAPLVPVGDSLLFGSYTACLNLGGIANISYAQGSNRMAYDICGCNLILNMLAQEKGLEYDKGGRLASTGKVNAALLDGLNNWAYLQKSPPKSLDKETMLAELKPVLQMHEMTTADKLATVCEHIAIQMSNATSILNGNILVTGGGALNDYLISKIENKCKMKVVVPEKNIVAYKEALVFAFLGLLRAQGNNNVLASVTGAKRNNLGGALYGGLPQKLFIDEKKSFNWLYILMFPLLLELLIFLVFKMLGQPLTAWP